MAYKDPRKKAAYEKARYQKLRLDPKHIEKRRAYHKALYERKCIDPEYKKNRAAQSRKYHRDNLEKSRRTRRNSHLLRTYGITVEEQDAMFNSQGRKCASCGSVDPGNARGFAVDHDHNTKAVRGILCHPCNVALGMVNDCEERLLSLIAYVKRHRCNFTL